MAIAVHLQYNEGSKVVINTNRGLCLECGNKQVLRMPKGLKVELSLKGFSWIRMIIGMIMLA